MRYDVLITRMAQAHLDAAFQWIAQDSPKSAQRWLDLMFLAIDDLSQHPKRCATAPESVYMDIPLHHLLVGKNRSQYRIVFRIHEKRKRVTILGIKHGFQSHSLLK